MINVKARPSPSLATLPTPTTNKIKYKRKVDFFLRPMLMSSGHRMPFNFCFFFLSFFLLFLPFPHPPHLFGFFLFFYPSVCVCVCGLENDFGEGVGARKNKTENGEMKNRYRKREQEQKDIECGRKRYTSVLAACPADNSQNKIRS